MTSDAGGDREFLVDLESRSIRAFPKGTSFGESSDDGTLALLSTPSTGKTSPQLIVRIPSKN
jgi:hypothetical protein